MARIVQHAGPGQCAGAVADAGDDGALDAGGGDQAGDIRRLLGLPDGAAANDQQVQPLKLDGLHRQMGRDHQAARGNDRPTAGGGEADVETVIAAG
nr:hypothetical protein [Chromobacterium violaceum]